MRCALDIPRQAEIPAQPSGVYYEPRSLWSMLILSTESVRPYQFFREDFRNGSRWPITLNRLAVAPINYAFRTANGSDPGQSMAVISSMKIVISSPQRQSFSRIALPLSGYTPEPVWSPGRRYVSAAGDNASSIFGTSVLKPDYAVRLPPRGAIQLDLGGWTRPDLSSPAYASIEDVDYTAIFRDTGGTNGGSGLVRTNQSLDASDNSAFLESPNVVQSGASESDVTPDYPPSPTGLTQPWPGGGQFSAQEFSKQSAARSGSSNIDTIAVTLDQIAQDNAIALGALSGIGVTPLALRVPSRVRTVSGGTGEFWWRQGAPLGLVFDTITPAVVYRLPVPITLAPGDLLNVELLKDPATPEGGSPPGTIPSVLGVSFNGYAVIDG